MTDGAATRFLERYLRPGILFYLVGITTASQSVFLSETFLPLSISTFALTMLVSVLIPAGFIAAGFVMRNNTRYRSWPILSLIPDAPPPPPGGRSILQRFDWLFLAIFMFTLWSAGYFLVAHLTGSLKMHTLMLDLDRRIPFKEEYVWFYLTVYMLYLMPFFVMKNKPFAKMVMLSYISVLVIHYTLYFVFPVTFPREIPDTGKHFSIWALKMVYNGDTPWNCFPSSHCAMALMAALVLLEIDFHFGMYGIFIALTIGISTVFIKQHYIVDVIAGYGVTLLVYYAYFKGKIIDILNTKQRELMQRMESAVESRLEEIVRRVVREELARHGVSGKQDSGGDKRQA